MLASSRFTSCLCCACACVVRVNQPLAFAYLPGPVQARIGVHESPSCSVWSQALIFSSSFSKFTWFVRSFCMKAYIIDTFIFVWSGPSYLYHFAENHEQENLTTWNFCPSRRAKEKFPIARVDCYGWYSSNHSRSNYLVRPNLPSLYSWCYTEVQLNVRTDIRTSFHLGSHASFVSPLRSWK